MSKVKKVEFTIEYPQTTGKRNRSQSPPPPLHKLRRTDGKKDIPPSSERLPSLYFRVNASREAARECLSALAGLACDELFSGMLPPVCAGAFSDPAQTASVLNNFACSLEREELEPICGE